MDEHYMRTLLGDLKSTSSSQVQESLLKIRSKIIVTEKDVELFIKCGGIIHLIPHLRKPNERILDLTLSILGNCCLNNKCRFEIGRLNIVPSIISVLKTVCRDSIVGRACRVVGNLSQRTSNAKDFHNHGAVPALVTLIESRDNNTSYPTLIMAVRAIRQLWIVTEKRGEMLSVNSVRCVATLLTSECESAGIFKSDYLQCEPLKLRKSQEELICGILKCLVYFTTHVTAQCAEQIKGDGRGYQCLVALTKTFEPLALRCLMNLCFLSVLRPSLGSAGLVLCLVDILRKISEVSWWPEGAARTLSQLCCESVNRARIRRCGGLPLLIAAAREHMFALRALLQYVFDDESFQMLVNEGIVGLLTDELKKHLTTMGNEHDYKNPIQESNNDETLKSNQDKTEKDHTVQENVSLFKRRNRLSINNEDELNVVIERDNMFVGFSETIDSDASDSQNDGETRRKQWNHLKRARSKSPTAFMKRSRMWGTDVYWEMKSEQDRPSTSRKAMSPEVTPMSPYSDGASGFSPEYRGSNKRGHSDWSPESGFSTGEGSAASPHWTEYQWSPSSSAGPTSPFSVANEDTSDSEISGRYSPVCSEHEETIASSSTTAVALDAAQAALDELAMDDAYVSYADEPFKDERVLHVDFDMNSSRIACILVLLYRLANGSYDSKRDEPVVIPVLPNNVLEPLTSKDCLNAILDYVAKCRNPMGRVARILSLIFGNCLCMLNILKHNIVLRIYKMSITTEHPECSCQQCSFLKKFCVRLMNQLTKMAESSYGIGEISYQLLRGSDHMKKTLCLTLPYIVKSKAILRKYYIECNAMKILFSIVPETTEEFENYVTVLKKLCTCVRIKDPKGLENRFTGRVCARYEPILDGLSKYEIVTFELDDLSTVKANRTFLCENSEVFNAMLMGCFRESKEESVRLKNVTKSGLEYLLTLLQSGLNDFDLILCDVKVFPMAVTLETNLEVLMLADRFLLDKIKILLSSAILQFYMTPDTVDQMYIWSLNEGMGFLCVESVAYVLTGKMSKAERMQAFKKILNLEYKDQWMEDIKSIIIRQLEKWP